MLVIENNFDAFDPSLGRWSVVWFSDLADKPEVLWRVFAALAKKIQRGEDIFKYLESLSRGGKYDAIAKYIEVKPGLFGTTVNVKAIAEDLLGLGAKNAT